MAITEAYRAATSAYVVFGIMAGIPQAIGIAAALTTPVPWTFLLIPAAAYGFACFWLSRFRLAFLPDRLFYASLFGGERALPYQSITSIASASLTSPYESPLTVSVQSKTGEELRINIKVFPREAVRRLMALKHDQPGR